MFLKTPDEQFFFPSCGWYVILYCNTITRFYESYIIEVIFILGLHFCQVHCLVRYIIIYSCTGGWSRFILFTVKCKFYVNFSCCLATRSATFGVLDRERL